MMPEAPRQEPGRGLGLLASLLIHTVAIVALLRLGHVQAPPPPPVNVTLEVVPAPLPVAQTPPADSPVASGAPVPATTPPPAVAASPPVPPLLSGTVEPESAIQATAPEPTRLVAAIPAPRTPIRNVRPTRQHAVTRTDGVTDPPSAEAATTSASSQAAPPQSAPPAPPPAPAPVSTSWQSDVSAWLQAHKTYPREAREGGEEGTVTVRFLVGRDGQVRGVVLVRGSGVAALDAAAVALLRGARVPSFPPAMTQDEVSVTVAIRYALQR